MPAYTFIIVLVLVVLAATSVISLWMLPFGFVLLALVAAGVAVAGRRREPRRRLIERARGTNPTGITRKASAPGTANQRVGQA